MSHLPVEYFERLYADDDDPWGFESRWYEARKYALTLASLPRQRYRRAFEPGCSNGVLTAELAARCDAVIACELVPAAAARAHARVIELPHAEIHAQAIPEYWPDGTFDLVVLSEVAYYLTAAGLALALAQLDDSLEIGGHVVAVHWTGETDYPQSGYQVHRTLDAHPTWQRIAHYRETHFVLAVYEHIRGAR